MPKTPPRKRKDTTACIYPDTQQKLRAIAHLEGRPIAWVIQDMTEERYRKVLMKVKRTRL